MLIPFTLSFVNSDVSQSKTTFKFEANLAIDGNLETCSIAEENKESNQPPWWRVVFDKAYNIENLVIYFATDQSVRQTSMINNAKIFVSPNNQQTEEYLCHSFSTTKKSKSEVSDECTSHEYKCHDGPCIPKDWLCDGTLDCRLGDDEATSCKMKCEEGKFKCTKRDLCINMTAVCDGNVDCQDYSDEHSCFETHTGLELITATFKGETDFYICSQGWKIDYSIDICQQHHSFHLATSYEALGNRTRKFLTIKEDGFINKMSSFMDLFKPSLQCQTENFVNIHCDNTTASFCGTRGDLDIFNFGPYIIRGENAKQGAWPWQVHLLIEGNYYCGGSIISERWILTAAHCIHEKQFSELYIKVGSIKFNDPYREKLKISHVALHPDYDKSDGNDVALLRLSAPIIFSPFIRPICLPDKELSWRELMSYRHCVIVGFGRTEAGNPIAPEHLRQARMNIMTNQECAKYVSVSIGGVSEFRYYYFLESNRMFCVGSIPNEFGRNICMGNSGNGFVCQDKRGIWTQVGIVTSFFVKPGYPCSSSLFTHVDQYLDFIQRVTEKGEFLLSKDVKAHENGIVLMVIAAIFNNY